MTISGITLGGPGSAGGVGIVGGGGAQVGIPDVEGLPQAEAESRLQELGLRTRIIQAVAEGTAGTVFSQNPRHPDVRPKGTVVTLVIVVSPPVPSDIGARLDDLAEAVAALETDEAAENRNAAILTRLDEIGKRTPGSQQKS